MKGFEWILNHLFWRGEKDKREEERFLIVMQLKMLSTANNGEYLFHKTR